MGIKRFKLCFEIDRELVFHEVQKIIYGKTEYGDDIFKLKIIEISIVKSINKNIVDYISKNYFDTMEEAIIDLQKQLPNNIKITSCQSCKYGNYCIFGNNANEIFCLIDFPPPKDKLDLADIFNGHWESLPVYELNHFCEKYQRATKDNDYFTYNSWDLYL